MATLIKRHRSKAAKVTGAALFVLLLFVNIQIATDSSSKGDIDLFGMKLSLFTPTYASGQNYKLSIGGGCPPGCQSTEIYPSGGYWGSCHLPGSECSIMPCYCF